MIHATVFPKSESEWLELRTVDITSTEVGALFGLTDSSYIPTLFELWHRKKGNYSVEFEENDRSRWGKRLQDSIAKGIAEDNGWVVRPMTEYMRVPEHRLGASFDFSIEGTPPGILEIKNVDSLVIKNKWIIEGDDIEAPPAIELQLQHQLLVSNRPYGYIAALVGGNRVLLIRREADKKIHEAIIREADKFWKSIDANEPPKPDFERDAETIARLYNHAEPGKVINADMEIEDAMKLFKEANRAATEWAKTKDSIKAHILTKIGDAEKVIGSNWTISAGVVGPTWIERYERKGFRQFKTYFKK